MHGYSAFDGGGRSNRSRGDNGLGCLVLTVGALLLYWQPFFFVVVLMALPPVGMIVLGCKTPAHGFESLAFVLLGILSLIFLFYIVFVVL